MKNSEPTKKYGKLIEDMEALFMHQLFRSFGMIANDEPFRELGRSIHKTIIRRHRHNLLDLESILFGQSGLLPVIPVDGYSAELLYRYTNFRYSYNLLPINAEGWTFNQPIDFPTIRIAQLTMLLHREERLYAKCTNPQIELAELSAIFQVATSDYWEEHFRFGIYSEKQVKQVGEDVVESIIDNTIIPIRTFSELQEETES